MATAAPLVFPHTRHGFRDLNQPSRAADPIPVNIGDDERAISAAAGGVLAGLGIALGSCLGLTMIWTGAALLLRGATGHCIGYALMGKRTN